MISDAIRSIQLQSVPVSYIVVVDNDSQDGTPELISSSFPDVHLCKMTENIGPAGGFAEGFQKAIELGADYVWLFNDDATAKAAALERCIAMFRSTGPETGMVGTSLTSPSGRVISGASWRRGLPVPVEPGQGDEFTEVDLLTFNGALLKREAIAACGVPRADYFMMWEEYDYCLRLRSAGYKIISITDELVTHQFAGSKVDGGQEPLFRDYYQTRNHLRWTLAHLSLANGFGFLSRHIHVLGSIIIRKDRKLARLRIRARAVFDALAGKMGRTVNP